VLILMLVLVFVKENLRRTPGYTVAEYY
jgi:hypothetical protein